MVFSNPSFGFQLQALWFESDRKKHFVTQIAQDSDVKLAKKQNKVMYTSTATFLEICSYISPGTGHEKWVKTYSAKLSKLWFP